MSIFRYPGPSGPAGRLTAVLILLFLSIGVAGSAFGRTLVVGSISLDPVGEARVFQPFADFLAKKLRSQGIDGGKVVVADSIDKMAAMIRDREVDLFVDSSVTALMVNELAGSEFLLRRWKEGRDAYRSVVVVRRESGITSLTDLSGETVAFEEPFSTSGFVLPALAISRVGLRLVPLSGTAEMPPNGAVGYVMGYDNETQMTWVERHQVTAAAMAERDYHDLAETALTPLRVLYVSPQVPYHVVVYGKHLNHVIVGRIRAILLNAHDSKQGVEMLDSFQRTTMFDEIPSELLNNVTTLAPGLTRIMDTGN